MEQPRTLVPDQAGNTQGYWCTWYLQNHIAASAEQSNAFGFANHSMIADTLTASNLKAYAFERDFLTSIRPDLYVVYDLGWDVPPGAEFDGAGNWMLGSQIVSEEKFPFCTGRPAERLKKLVEWTIGYGWKGVGLWVPAHAYGDGQDGRDFTEAETEAFFRERLQWSAEAGIAYWKVDYGKHCSSAAFRRMLTDIGREVAPGLLIEHARNGGPFNDEECPWDTKNLKYTGRFTEWDDGEVLRHSKEVAAFSDVFRTYDVSRSLSVPTTLDRVVQTLRALQGEDTNVLLNCESEPFIGAILGNAIGIMEYDCEEHQELLQAFTRALRWQRLAPPWEAGADQLEISEEYLSDEWHFPPGSDWVDYLGGRTVRQDAPAVVSRNIPLPQAADAPERPFIMASKHPNGAVAIGSLPRRSVREGRYDPLAEVCLEVHDSSAPIGVFGRFAQVRLQLPAGEQVRAVFAQDLAGDVLEEVTSNLSFHENVVTLPGDWIDRVCNHAQYPALILRLVTT